MPTEHRKEVLWSSLAWDPMSIFTSEDVRVAMFELQLADLDPICPLHITGRANKRTELVLPTMALLVVLKNLQLAYKPKGGITNVLRTLHTCLDPILEATGPVLVYDSKLYNTSVLEGMTNVRAYTKLKAAAATRLVREMPVS